MILVSVKNKKSVLSDAVNYDTIAYKETTVLQGGEPPAFLKAAIAVGAFRHDPIMGNTERGRWCE